MEAEEVGENSKLVCQIRVLVQLKTVFKINQLSYMEAAFLSDSLGSSSR